MSFSQQNVEEFISRGILVIPQVLTSDEIQQARKGFHDQLSSEGVNVNDLDATACNLKKLSSTGGSGGILDIFYSPWKLALNEHPKIIALMQQLWKSTYCCPHSSFYHPFGEIDSHQGYIYIDRVCCRVPDAVSELHGDDSSGKKKKKKTLQRSLTPHLDCCPHKLYGHSDKEHPKWRPIQAFVSLTDTTAANEGGFEACPGVHARFDDWVANRAPTSSSSGEVLPPPCVGEFTPIRPKEDADILSLFEHIPCRAGDLVVWDYRIPHANSRYNLTDRCREVVYLGFLPNIPMNANYAKEQRRRFECGMVPSDQWHTHSGPQPCDYVFSELGRQWMGYGDDHGTRSGQPRGEPSAQPLGTNRPSGQPRGEPSSQPLGTNSQPSGQPRGEPSGQSSDEGSNSQWKASSESSDVHNETSS